MSDCSFRKNKNSVNGLVKFKIRKILVAQNNERQDRASETPLCSIFDRTIPYFVYTQKCFFRNIIISSTIVMMRCQHENENEEGCDETSFGSVLVYILKPAKTGFRNILCTPRYNISFQIFTLYANRNEWSCKQ